MLHAEPASREEPSRWISEEPRHRPCRTGASGNAHGVTRRLNAFGLAAAGCLSHPSSPHGCTGGSAGSRKVRNQVRRPGCNRGAAIQGPYEEAPVVTSLTDTQRAELARKNAEVNKRSQDNARARGGR